ncbi:sugar phosphate isomerase/epimerase [Stieleria sp. TO1_6]|uniref:sugar phosphate isomerase/epimerase family protein n=1 Tax=Stieleria tagensis TaxID=2956795 RepID=UPI00209B653E|nr:sugar phosphate isomerase/epimerase family protein [Stieleria tagensis]MCO8124180.1 sugar phosphate isomerase/epimerase [Stieleria tagensis]
MNKIDRRSAITQLGALTAGVALADETLAEETWADKTLAADSKPTTGLGIVMYDCKLRRSLMKEQDGSFDLYHPFSFLSHCRSLGAGGAHLALGVMSPVEAGRFREQAEQYGMFVDAIVSPPGDENDLQRFEAEIKTASEVGVQSARTVIIPGRRYERFKTFEAFQEFERRGRRMVEIATPIVERHRVRLAIENHKDQRIEDRLRLYEHIDSEFVGACVDTGNSFALLDDLYGSIEALAPYAFSVHFKDQAITHYDDGFLLGDIPLGQGSFDLKRMAAILKAKKPELYFSLEVITRDALKVPCLTDQYWQSVPEASGSDLARTLRFARDHQAGGQTISSLPLPKQVEIEDTNISASLQYAAQELGL